jgi:hypothetical protein
MDSTMSVRDHFFVLSEWTGLILSEYYVGLWLDAYIPKSEGNPTKRRNEYPL